jgi:hypothetical protein
MVYDDSGSMYHDAGVAQTRWSQGKYALEVFAAMLEENDTMNIWLLNGGRGPTIKGAENMESRVKQIHNMALGKGATPFAPVIEAYDALQNEAADIKWLILITDGTSFNDGGNLDWCVARMENYVSAGTNAALLTIDSPSTVYSNAGLNIYQAKSDNIRERLTELCNKIFLRNKLQSVSAGNTTINVDVPLSKLFVFVQGDNAGVSGIGDIAPNEKAAVKYTEDYPEAITDWNNRGFAGSFADTVDRSLVGQVAVFERKFDKNTDYKLNVSNAQVVEVYYEPEANAGMALTDVETGERFVYVDGKTPFREIQEGDYIIEFGLIDENDDFVRSALLGEVEGFAAFEGDIDPKSPRSGDLVHISTGKFYGEVVVNYLAGKYTKQLRIPETEAIRITPPPLPDIDLPAPEGDLIYRARYDGISNADEEYIIYSYREHDGYQYTRDEITDIALSESSAYVDFDYEVDRDGYIHITPKITPQWDVNAFAEEQGAAEFNLPLTVDITVKEGAESAPIHSVFGIPFELTVFSDAPLEFTLENGSFDVLSDGSVVPKNGDAILTVTRNGEPLPEDVWRAMDVPVVAVREDKHYGFTVAHGDDPSTFILTAKDFTGDLSKKSDYGNRYVDISGSATIDGGVQTGAGEARVSFRSSSWWINNGWWVKILAAILILLALLVILYAILKRTRVMPKRITMDETSTHVNRRSQDVAEGIDVPDPIVGRRSIDVSGKDVVDPKLFSSLSMSVRPLKDVLTKSSMRDAELLSASCGADEHGLQIDIDGTKLVLNNGEWKPREGETVSVTNGSIITVRNNYNTLRGVLNFE